MCAKKVVEEVITEEKIIDRPLAKAIHEYMMPYAEYIILDRAIPRVEDGLKPVQRRILYSMYEMNLKPDGPYKKSARVVGDCLGKYHPHGDTSIYQAMVNMAQDFNMRNTLVKGHGNFGSIDGDRAAAMRYTEVKLEPLAYELLRDLDKGTVKWGKNFDDSLEEPEVLPGRFPNLLVNGSMGIAIGLSTKIPPHNLTEVIDGAVALIENPNISLADMMNIIKGPDFPGGGYIERGNLEELYCTGKAQIPMGARHEIEIADNNRQQIVITELPYNVNKADLQQKILDLRDSLTLKNGKNDNILGGITEILDESDKSGIRIVIKLKKGEDAKKIVEFLYKKTDLRCNFNANMVAIADGKPRLMGLIEILRYYIKHQKEVVLNRSRFDLNIAKKREHVLDGLIIALPNIDEVIAIIKGSTSRTDAKIKLKDRFQITDIQADAILEIKLANLTKLEITKLEKELVELKKRIAELTKIINSARELSEVVKNELIEIRNQYKTKRLTLVVDSIDSTIVDPCEEALKGGKCGYAVIDVEGGLKFLTQRQYMSVHKDAESSGYDGLAKAAVYTDKAQTALVFSNFGNCYKLDTDNILESKWTDKGSPLNELFAEAATGEKAVALMTVEDAVSDDEEIYIYTRGGMVKRSLLKDYIVNKSSYQVMVLKEGDEVIGVEKKKPLATIVYVTDDGMCVNSEVDDIPLQGRKAGGVIGMSLSDGANVVFAGQCEGEEAFDGEGIDCLGELVLVTDRGYGKRLIVSYIDVMKRNRKGLKAIDLSKDYESKVVYADIVMDPYDIVLVDSKNKFEVINTEDIGIEARTTRGKPLMGQRLCKLALRQFEEDAQ
jgi:DNA gyrase subunit A